MDGLKKQSAAAGAQHPVKALCHPCGLPSRSKTQHRDGVEQQCKRSLCTGAVIPDTDWNKETQWTRSTTAHFLTPPNSPAPRVVSAKKKTDQTEVRLTPLFTQTQKHTRESQLTPLRLLRRWLGDGPGAGLWGKLGTAALTSKCVQPSVVKNTLQCSADAVHKSAASFVLQGCQLGDLFCVHVKQRIPCTIHSTDETTGLFGTGKCRSHQNGQ